MHPEKSKTHLRLWIGKRERYFMEKSEAYSENLKSAIKKDFGIVLQNNEVLETGNRLISFFDLLFRFDQEDREKEGRTTQKLYGNRI